MTTTSKDVRSEKDAEEVFLGEAVDTQRKAVESVKHLPSAEKYKDKILMKMDRQNASWTQGGVIFTQEHPFQLIDKQHLGYFLIEEGFRVASKEELLEWYNNVNE